MDNPKLWQKRMEALRQAITETNDFADHRANERLDSMKAKYGAFANNLPSLLSLPAEQRPAELQDVTRREVYKAVQEMFQIGTCWNILESLQGFTTDAFDFFYGGYYGDETNPPYLTVSPDYPERYVMRMLLNQVSYDLNILQRAITQRQDADGMMTQQGQTLFIADRLAAQALKPALTAGLLEDGTGIISYLGKTIRARLVPYYDTILLCIAFASMQQGSFPSRDFLAIPHEIGHHLYWNGTMPNSSETLRATLHKKLNAAGIKKRDWRRRWVEEIFADAYALIIGGPVVALDFQDMLDDDVPAHFRSDTDKHPIPELRPFIQTQILRKIKSQGNPYYVETPNRLDANWKAWIKQQWADRDVLAELFRVRGKRAKLTGQGVVDTLQPVLDVVLDVLGPVIPQDKNTAWSVDIIKEEDIEFYIANFEESEIADLIDSLNLDNSLAYLYLQFYKNAYPQDDEELMTILSVLISENLPENMDMETLAKLEQKYGERGNTFEERVEKIAGKAANVLCTEDWVKLFLFEGWSDEGPLGSGGKTTSSSSDGLDSF
ncbi:MAG: hypothetical protein H6636_09540 [Anaerolineales bacterium]|nr:hypothetical protein [Anaerolineales bacterium]